DIISLSLTLINILFIINLYSIIKLNTIISYVEVRLMDNTPKAFLQITLDVDPDKRGDAAKVYTTYKEPFLKNISGAVTKDLLIRDEDVQVLHGFNSVEEAKAYLESDLFNNDVVVGLKDLLNADPEVRVYSVN